MFLADIGSSRTYENNDVTNSLVCVTTNVNRACCRHIDGGAIGGWHFPNGSKVIRNSRAYYRDQQVFTRSGFTHQVHLNRRRDVMGPLGAYRCIVPEENNTGVLISATIYIASGFKGKNVQQQHRVY